jgi:hypothetical protein
VTRALAAALAAFVLLAAPARAQQVYTPVVGAGSFNSAPILPPGSYSDTVEPAEYIYYAIRVGAGQRLRLSGATSTGPVDQLHLGVAAVYLTIHSPTRMDVSAFADGQAEGDLGQPGGVAFTGPTVQASGDTDTDGPWTGPGVYFLSVQAVYRGSQPDPPRAEIPFHFTVSLVGAVQPTPTPTPVRTATPTATPRPTATPSGSGHGGGNAAAAAGAGVGGLLLGVIAGIVMRQRRR